MTPTSRRPGRYLVHARYGAERRHRIPPNATFQRLLGFDIDKVCDLTSDLPHMLANPAHDFAVAARRLGVNRSSRVVVYDTHGLFSAP